MLKTILQTACIALCFVSTSALAVIIPIGPGGGTNIDVGSLDTLVGQDDHVSGGTAGEAAWVNSILSLLGGTATYEIKTEDIAYYATDVADTFAFALAVTNPATDYFIVKNSTKMALFENLANVNWGVFDASLLDGGINLPSGGFTISHVTQFSFDDPGTSPATGISEPGLGVLFSVSLLGLVAARRRIRKAK